MTIKTLIHVEANAMNMYAKFLFHPPYGFWGEDFLFFCQKLPFILPWQPIKFSDLDKIHMNRRGLLKKHFCKKKNPNLCSETAKIASFHFSHFKSMATITRVLIRLKQKTQLFVPSAYRCYMWNLVRIGFMASEEMSAYTISSPMSLWFRWANNATSSLFKSGNSWVCIHLTDILLESSVIYHNAVWKW